MIMMNYLALELFNWIQFHQHQLTFIVDRLRTSHFDESYCSYEVIKTEPENLVAINVQDLPCKYPLPLWQPVNVCGFYEITKTAEI